MSSDNPTKSTTGVLIEANTSSCSVKSRIDFRKLDRASLIQILKHYAALKESLMEASKDELAAMCAKVFEGALIETDDIVNKFSKRFTHSQADSSPTARKRLKTAREHLDSPARLGEQVAANFSRTLDIGQWVLGNVIEYDASADLYKVQDEDDINKIDTLPARGVIRLDESSSHLRKGDDVLAVYPETTSFYRAIVAKRGHNEVIVRFEDDEDELGIVHPKRVPARFVLSLDMFDDEYSDEE
jgi:hypothetical protein